MTPLNQFVKINIIYLQMNFFKEFGESCFNTNIQENSTNIQEKSSNFQEVNASFQENQTNQNDFSYLNFLENDEEVIISKILCVILP